MNKPVCRKAYWLIYMFKKGENMDNEFILEDRIQKIQQIVNEYGQGSFYISYSGGKIVQY